HEYGFLWTPGAITFTVDRQAVHTFTGSELTTSVGGFAMANAWTGNPNWGGGPPTTQTNTYYQYLEYDAGANSIPPPDNGAGGVTLKGTAGNDILNGQAGNDILDGLGGNDSLYGLGGDDLLNGGTGADTMLGGTGNDVYAVDNAGDVVTENAGEGTDTV